ncbi:MAG: MBL fold metallo-hydrolase [Ardenticatenaceae bacterium]
MSSFHHFKVGDFKCTVLNDMSGSWTMWQAFPGLARDELQAEMEAGGYSEQLTRQGNVLLVDTGEQKVLVDTGLPSVRGGQLVNNLQAIGVSPDEIDTVIITHGDGDHIGGLSNYTEARIVMPPKSYRLWTDGVEGMVEEFLMLFRDKLSEKELAARRAGRLVYPQSLPSLQERIDLVEPETEFIPGIRLVDAPGHRSDHIAVEISSAGETLLHIVDAFRHPIQAKRPDFYSLFDSYPQQLAQTTKMLMARAADKNALVFGAHLPFPSLIRITRDGNDFVWRTMSS